ncbi:hypothetical protein AYO38_02260 [bacterium SCGC AG-212-C10]|nr:hypothetical protein AYO38_02260 [bacterium SCGC AG-212-C10]
MHEKNTYWQRKMGRRTVIRGASMAGVGAAAYALTGCGDDDATEPSTTPDGLLPTAVSSPVVTQQPKPGGSLSFQLSQNPPSLDPYTQTSFVASYVQSMSYSKLYRFKAGTPEFSPTDQTMEPDLAQAMPEQPDEMTYVFKIKPNVTTHNGRAITAEDVRYAFDRYINYEKSVHKTGLAFIDKMTVTDANTLTVTSKYPYADTVNYLGGNLGTWISPKEIAESPDAATKMDGTGPFMLSEFKPNVSLTWKKNPNYFDKPFPYLDEVTAYITMDESKRVVDFSTKSVDLSWQFSAQLRDQLKQQRPDAKFEPVQGIAYYIHMRTDRPPFNDKRVRQALSMGLDRKAMRDATSKGEGVPDQLYFVGYDYARQVKDLPQAKYWEHNIAEARKLLDAALGAGTEIDVTLEHIDAAAYGQAFADHGTLAAAQLKAIGMNVKDQPMPYAQYISSVYQGNYEGIGMAGRAIYYWMDYPTEQFTMKPRRGRINLSYVNDAKLEDLLDKQRGQFKLEERVATVRQIEELVAEEQYQVYFSTDTRSYFWDPSLVNYRATAWYPYTHLMKGWRDKA